MLQFFNRIFRTDLTLWEARLAAAGYLIDGGVLLELGPETRKKFDSFHLTAAMLPSKVVSEICLDLFYNNGNSAEVMFGLQGKCDGSEYVCLSEFYSD